MFDPTCDVICWYHPGVGPAAVQQALRLPDWLEETAGREYRARHVVLHVRHVRRATTAELTQFMRSLEALFDHCQWPGGAPGWSNQQAFGQHD